MAVAARSASSSLLTYEQYMAEGEINRRYDILDGARVFMTNPNMRHQRILLNIARHLYDYEQRSQAGQVLIAPCDVLIRYSPLRTRQPDVLFISHARFGNRDLSDPSPLEPAPELAVEILSPSDTVRVLADKIADYCGIGVQECWVVSPGEQTLEILRLTSEGPQSVQTYAASELAHSVILPDLTFPVAEVFAL